MVDARQINIAVKKMGKAYLKGEYEGKDEVLKEDFQRVYRASDEGKKFNALSHRIMISLNRTKRLYPFHHYGELLQEITEIAK